MPLWKDKSGLKQQVGEPSIVEQHRDQIHTLECEKAYMRSEAALLSARDEQTRLIRELEQEQDMTVMVDRHCRGFFRIF